VGAQSGPRRPAPGPHRFGRRAVALSAGRGQPARPEQLPALLFDEVDSGIGGQTLIKVAERIRHLASRQQVILITHWPQLARLADEHFAIRKEVHEGVTYTLCACLSPAERQAELGRMAGEAPPVTQEPGHASGNFI
jgi:DNA repair protein RecN (Recombination protein N)